MAELTRILRGSDPVSETEANAVFDILIPVVEKVPDAPDEIVEISIHIEDDDIPAAEKSLERLRTRIAELERCIASNGRHRRQGPRARRPGSACGFRRASAGGRAK